LAVVIDVFRAFTVGCYLAERGAEEIIAAREIATARERKAGDPERVVLIGERHGEMVPGFDFGNSPSQLRAADLRGKVAVHTTHAGTQNLCAVPAVVPCVTGSFVNAGAVARYIKQREPEEVSLICSGLNDSEEATEDTLCALYLESILRAANPDFGEIRQRIDAAETSKRFFDENRPESPLEDYHLCLELDRFDLVLVREDPGEGVCRLKPLAC
jgi:2-phosphosulfolactate phosphatase